MWYVFDHQEQNVRASKHMKIEFAIELLDAIEEMTEEMEKKEKRDFRDID